ncbi:rhomboid family protein [Pseudooceanicola batsensis HTCC2597]|uniref:Rhomboid family protein n=1 Tax=Pseudooceanicola batsensis (strain ATCC BAA-863 / DSM 15984 / KCTC 12145 / HTCC2597) TaxID=252305 RepID=A3TTW5_PSEBH|nr:rhomboid family intramembrane serine protease [Pseudooceanicola batsensis]EAQ05092.1 rhomboid family protein [Pseudooceanicola batsensis HTCC2597]
MSFNSEERALNPIPPLILALFVVSMGVELVFQLGARGLVGGPQAVGWRQAALMDFGFQGQFATYLAETGQLRPDFLIRFLSYPFVHVSFTQALIAGVMLLALGKFVGEIMAPFAVFLLYVASTIGGALAMWAVGGETDWLFGGFPPVYGLIGGFTYLLWVRLGAMGASQVQAFRLIAMLAALQLIFGVLFGFTRDWPADLGGFATGFAVSPALAPGGFTALVERLKRRG